MTSTTSISFMNLIKISRLIKPHYFTLQPHALPFTCYLTKNNVKLPDLHTNLTSNRLTRRCLASSHPTPEFPQRRTREVDPTTPQEMPQMPRDPPEVDPTPPEFIIPPEEIGPPRPMPDPIPNTPGPDFPNPPIPSPPGPDLVPPPFPGGDPLPPHQPPPDVVPPIPPEVFPPPLTPPPDIAPPTGPIIV